MRTVYLGLFLALMGLAADALAVAPRDGAGDAHVLAPSASSATIPRRTTSGSNRCWITWCRGCAMVASPRAAS